VAESPERHGSPARFPRSVFGSGTDPDPRFTLANERTYLAWIRTTLALLAAGVALEALKIPANATLRTVVAVSFIALAAVSSAQAWFGWVRAERALRSGSSLPPPLVALPLAVGVLLTCAAVAVGLFV
jgi:putative membrane protein